ncbi:MAG TPA: response regulator [Acidimicrobiales bacterium]|nr:response regulator [Acidimicrobiales bacterium]
MLDRDPSSSTVLTSGPAPGRDRFEAVTPSGWSRLLTRRGLVLYISDDPESRILITRMARRWQTVKLLLSETGRGGLRLALVRRPDVIVLDDRLPDAPGADVLGQLGSLLTTASTPVVVIGSTTTPEHRASFLGSGAAHYLTKPLHIAELERTVGTLLELAAMR